MKSLAFLLAVVWIHCTLAEVAYIKSRHKSQTGMIKIYRDDETKKITECYIFGNEAIVNMILEGEGVVAHEVNRRIFQRLLRECAPEGSKAVRRRVRRDRRALRKEGLALRKERRRINRERKRARATERAARRAERQRNKQNRYDARKERINARKEKSSTRINERNARRNKNNKRREKRNVLLGYEILFAIYPGTLWCGAGNITEFAEDADGLGEHKELDAACREHDSCPISVVGWGSGLGLVNTSPITCSDCQCDELFRNSLQAINDEHSNLIGDVFFNLISLDCVKEEYPIECVSYDWLGIICLEYQRDETAPKEYEFFDGLNYTVTA